MTWEKIVQNKKRSLLSKIPKEWILEKVPTEDELPNIIEFVDSKVTEEENRITYSTLLELSEKITEKKLTSLQITKAFAHRAAIIHQLINNLSEIFFEQAFDRAKELDNIYEATGTKVGPLHGLPVSLKDQINLEGIDSSIGFVGLVGKPKSKEDVSVIADILKDLGAIFFVKTAVPMAMMAPDTVSNLHGQTLNPLNRKLSAGGSSGGESSLIRARGALIGLSTDIGGSIRIPAAFNGVFALRPSSDRLPYARMANSNPNQIIVPSVVGPSAVDIDDMKWFVKSILDAKPWLYDPKVPPIPWREYEVPKKLAFGILSDNGFIKPHPPVQRSLELIKKKLIAQGHEVIEWMPPLQGDEIIAKINRVFTADGMKDLFRHCEMSGEPPIKQLVYTKSILKELSVSEYWEITGLKYEDQQKYDKYWQSTKSETSTGRPVDAWISPAWESASYLAGQNQTYHTSYTKPVNYIDYPSVIVPVIDVDKSIDQAYDREAWNEEDKHNWSIYDPDLFDGMPVAIQVITPRYEEERAIALGKALYELAH